MSKIVGLNENQVLGLRLQFGENVLLVKKEISWTTILWAQFKSPIIYILLAVGGISFLMGEKIDGSLTLAVLVVNVLMGFYQEYSAHKTLEALRRLIKPKTVVIRDGKRIEIDAKELVPGDYVVLSSGDKVPADGSLIEASKILVNEAILTGEEEAIPKFEIGSPNLFMGTIIVSGKGVMKVEKIGRATEMGKIGQSLEEITEKETPLQIRINAFIKNLAWIILTICILIFILGIWHGENIWEMLKLSIILSITALPEALPIALTVILALGMRKILKRNGLVRKLLSIEALGSTSVICTDKTGTLTEGNMKVVKFDVADKERSLQVLVLNNEQKSSLEIALWNYAEKVDKQSPQEIYDQYEKIDEEPFDSEKKYSMSINRIDGENVALLMGAPEKIISFCNLNEKKKKDILAKIDLWANEGLRILGLAYKKDGNLVGEKKDFQYLGLVGLQDPIRAEVKEVIATTQNAGIKIKIVTGDYRKTAERVAASLGFKIEADNVIEGQALEEMSDEELKLCVEKTILFTRVLPHQKLKIVKALQENGEVVAMTGDGVNDAPALKKSDIGIAVGGATDVAKEASDLILLDSNFKTIVAACEEGRLILSNIKKVVGYVLSNSFAGIILIFGAIILDLPAPLVVVQILWINLICDGPPDILLGFEPKENDLMERRPKGIQKEGLINRQMKFLIFITSSTIGLLSLLIFWYYKNVTNDLTLSRTIVFAALALVSLVYVLSFKNLKKSIFTTENFFANTYLFYGLIYGFLLILVAIYVPFFNNLLKTTPLQFSHWLPVLSVAFITTFFIEIVKYIGNKKYEYH
ncbi:MAG: HAD-IC family P-type ATPase [Patescibacteria group bacterium]|nr:HAD-IC family P-type ATPase [Patescibacteria group bacterium]